MSLKHITFSNISTDDNVSLASLSDCPDASSDISKHDMLLMSSGSTSASFGPSDPDTIVKSNISLELSSDHASSSKPRRRKRKSSVKNKSTEVSHEDNPAHKLTYNEFMFHPIKPGEEDTVLNYHPNQLVIKLLPKDYIYGCLTPYKQRAYKHDCPLIHNTAPNLDQYYKMFKVYQPDLLYKKSSDTPMPKDLFFTKLNRNFVINRVIPERTIKPKYWYHYNIETKKHEQWPLLQAQAEYCNLYQESIFDNYESKATFSILHSYAQQRDLKYPIIVCGYNVMNSFERKTRPDPPTMYRSTSSYTFEYAFVEMLVNYPVLSMCSWAKS